ncbi:hypothetical protein PoB_004631300 [Plakobranchus ocellatus]|uniref:Uncharacterized protein n=1 Tax=Plakobranchus ocellatus TaxID=259542 RepID=A0AAV4BJM3_9GAST|nr:hypothetical protein PoB_004631300 [Plakobranchus ocellatus]
MMVNVSNAEFIMTRRGLLVILSITASPQQGDLKLSGPPSGQGAGGGARTRDRRIPANPKADSLVTVPLTPPCRYRTFSRRFKAC